MPEIYASEPHANELRELYALFLREMLPTGIPEPVVHIRVTENFKSDCYKFSNPDDRSYFDIYGVPDLNGRVILPLSKDAPFIVLIALRQFNDDQYQLTTVHEFTHLFDYHRFFIDHGYIYTSSEEIRQTNYFTEFYYWSEYHAKRFGIEYYSLRKWIEAHGELPKDGQVPFASVDFQTDYLTRQLKRIEPNVDAILDASRVFWEVFEHLIAYYGQQAVFQDPDSNELPDHNLPRELLREVLGSAALNIYWTLLPLRNYDRGIDGLANLRADLNEITTYVNQHWRIIIANVWKRIN